MQQVRKIVHTCCIRYCSIHVREMILDLCNCRPRYARTTNSHSSENHLSRTSIEMYYCTLMQEYVILCALIRVRTPEHPHLSLLNSTRAGMTYFAH